MYNTVQCCLVTKRGSFPGTSMDSKTHGYWNTKYVDLNTCNPPDLTRATLWLPQNTLQSYQSSLQKKGIRLFLAPKGSQSKRGTGNQQKKGREADERHISWQLVTNYHGVFCWPKQTPEPWISGGQFVNCALEKNVLFLPVKASFKSSYQIFAC